MDRPLLFLPGYYRCPVALPGAAERFDADIRSILDRMSREELISFAVQTIGEQASLAHENETPRWVYPSREARDEWWTILEAAEPSSFVKRVLARRRQRRLAAKLGIRSVTRYADAWFVTGFRWHEREGTRYPERYEPEYFRSMITSDGEFCEGWGVVHNVEDLSDHNLASFYYNFR